LSLVINTQGRCSEDMRIHASGEDYSVANPGHVPTMTH
jgi:hypothetical protein